MCVCVFPVFRMIRKSPVLFANSCSCEVLIAKNVLCYYLTEWSHISQDDEGPAKNGIMMAAEQRNTS